MRPVLSRVRRLLLLACCCLYPVWSLANDSRVFFAATIQGSEGRPVALATFQGKPLIVNFWARWCQPCRKEIPEFVSIDHRYRARGLQVLGVAIEDDVPGVQTFAKQNAMAYPVVLAADQAPAIMRALGNGKGVLPYTVVMDRQGRVISARAGIMSAADLEAAAQAALR